MENTTSPEDLTSTKVHSNDGMSAEDTTSVTRVTDPEKKDPKKVAAGRLAAASRKAKQERLLEELRAAKESVHSDVSAATVQKNNKPKKQQDAFLHTTRSVVPKSKDQPADLPVWVPWIIGIAGLAGVIYTYHRQPQKAFVVTNSQTAPTFRQQPPAAKQLKVDPFFME